MARSWVLVFTTFPVPTETFVQREVEALIEQGVPLRLYSLWGGAQTFRGVPIQRLGIAGILRALLRLPYWLWRAPGALRAVLGLMLYRRMPNLTNYGEQWLGLAAGLLYAREWAQADVRHAVWASAPTTALWLTRRLTGASYSFGAHAYDLFEHGGDMLLREKIAEGLGVRTSTEAGRQRLLAAGSAPQRTWLIRRGLMDWPRPSPVRPRRQPLRVLSVGRLVEKMGYSLQWRVYERLQAQGSAFEARVMGGGPLRERLQADLQRQGLDRCVVLEGAQPFSAVVEALAWADVLLFTGVVAASGDRAGLPNIIGEALAAGVPVVATPVGGVAEVIRPGENGLLAEDVSGLAEALDAVQQDDALAEGLHQAGQRWAREHFDARRNVARLREILEGLA
ncbi:MAG: group 1 glycosyl transferase [Puniceicoccaceae bacterium 5H]|nr:MAG: group 1 glycosyl transferase [Puniceicoccaceae bacterium 5H]